MYSILFAESQPPEHDTLVRHALVAGAAYTLDARRVGAIYIVPEETKRTAGIEEMFTDGLGIDVIFEEGRFLRHRTRYEDRWSIPDACERYDELRRATDPLEATIDLLRVRRPPRHSKAIIGLATTIWPRLLIAPLIITPTKRIDERFLRTT